VLPNAAACPESAATEAEIGSNGFITNATLKSDHVMWIFTKVVAGDQMLSFVCVHEEQLIPNIEKVLDKAHTYNMKVFLCLTCLACK
jgi:hypothetical protein